MRHPEVKSFVQIIDLDYCLNIGLVKNTSLYLITNTQIPIKPIYERMAVKRGS